MAQHIGCILENEKGEVIQDSNLNFASINLALWELDSKKEKYLWLHTIDEYCNTIFNELQVPYLINELESLNKEIEPKNHKLIHQFIKFINQIETHHYIKFIGD